jgi:hypothetical protein
MAQQHEGLISLGAFSRLSGWSRATVHRWVNAGKLPVRRAPGKQTRLLDVGELQSMGYLPIPPPAPDVEPDSDFRRALRDRDFDWLLHLAALAGDSTLSLSERNILRSIAPPPMPAGED